MILPYSHLGGHDLTCDWWKVKNDDDHSRPFPCLLCRSFLTHFLVLSAPYPLNSQQFAAKLFPPELYPRFMHYHQFSTPSWRNCYMCFAYFLPLPNLLRLCKFVSFHIRFWNRAQRLILGGCCNVVTVKQSEEIIISNIFSPMRNMPKSGAF